MLINRVGACTAMCQGRSFCNCAFAPVPFFRSLGAMEVTLNRLASVKDKALSCVTHTERPIALTQCSLNSLTERSARADRLSLRRGGGRREGAMVRLCGLSWHPGECHRRWLLLLRQLPWTGCLFGSHLAKARRHLHRIKLASRCPGDWAGSLCACRLRSERGSFG